jgi:hypothetical protein
MQKAKETFEEKLNERLKQYKEKKMRLKEEVKKFECEIVKL